MLVSKDFYDRVTDIENAAAIFAELKADHPSDGRIEVLRAEYENIVSDFVNLAGLLDYAERKPEDVSFDILRIIKEFLGSAGRYLDRAKIKTEISESDEGTVCKCDIGRFLICFSNVILNAAECSKGGGKIRYSVKKQGEYAKITVTRRLNESLGNAAANLFDPSGKDILTKFSECYGSEYSIRKRGKTLTVTFGVPLDKRGMHAELSAERTYLLEHYVRFASLILAKTEF